MGADGYSDCSIKDLYKSIDGGGGRPLDFVVVHELL